MIPQDTRGGGRVTTAGSARIAANQRFTRAHPCPICAGYDQAARAKGQRCYGFLSEDGQWAHCTRDEHAGQLSQNSSSNTYAHKLSGDCPCGAAHNPGPPPVEQKQKRTIVAVYDYGDFEVVRFDPKGFAQRRKSGEWGLGNVTPHLYRRQELLQADPSALVFIVEGEKDTDRLHGLGLVATCNPMGALKWRPEYAQELRDRQVVIIPDSDKSGRRHAEQVATSVSGSAGSVRVLALPKAKDVSDWLDAGNTLETLEALANTTPFWSPAPPSANGASPPQPLPDDVHLTDMGNACRSVARHGQNFRFCYAFTRYLVWDDTRWVSDDMGRMTSWAKETSLSIYQEAAGLYQEAMNLETDGQKDAAREAHGKAEATYKWAKQSEAVARLQAILELAKSEPGIPVTPAQLDSDPWLLNCSNGTIDLRTGALRPHSRDDLITKMAPVNFSPGATFDLWTRFLAEAIPDAETRSYIQRCAGASLAGIQQDDLILLVHGPGGTGKSTFREALAAALGEYAGVADLKTFTTADNPHAASPDLAKLRGLRMVAIAEASGAPIGALGLLKQATGGDKLQARPLFGQPFEFTPSFTLWIVGNERPQVSNTDSGIWRRMKEIPFVSKFASPDPSIRQTLKGDPDARSAILAWAVRGCLAWQEEGLGQVPSKVLDATEEYRADMDPLGDWLEDCTVAVPDAFTPNSALLSSYRDWAQSNGARELLGRKHFAQRLAQHYTPDHRHKHRGFAGIGLRQIGRDTCEVSRTPESQYDPSKKPSHMETFGNQTSPNVAPDTGQTQMPNVAPDSEDRDVSNNQPSRQTSLPTPCYTCDGTTFWRRLTGEAVCSRCHPPPPGYEERDDG